MRSGTKEALVANLLALLSERVGRPLEPTQAVTALVRLGIATGNAQRLLDKTTRPRISTVDEVAKKLGTSVAELLSVEGSISAGQSPGRARLAGTTVPPPAPGPRFADRREVSESDWGTLQDVLLVLEPAELERIRAKAERMRRVAAEQLDGLKGKP